MKVRGSAYRRPGARMLMTPSGKSAGMISDHLARARAEWRHHRDSRPHAQIAGPAQRHRFHHPHRPARRTPPCKGRCRHLRTHRAGNQRHGLRRAGRRRRHAHLWLHAIQHARCGDGHDHEHSGERIHHRIADARQSVRSSGLFEPRHSDNARQRPVRVLRHHALSHQHRTLQRAAHVHR